MDLADSSYIVLIRLSSIVKSEFEHFTFTLMLPVEVTCGGYTTCMPPLGNRSCSGVIFKVN